MKLQSARSVLVYRLGSLGDTVVALPCFHLIRRAFPSARITVLTNRPVEGRAAPLAGILDASGLIDDVLDYPVGLRSPGELTKLRRAIRSRAFDVAIHLTAARGLVSSVRDYAFLRACGIRNVIGVPLRREDLHVREIAPRRFESESTRLANRLGKLGDARLSDPRSWDLCLTSDERRRADELLRDRGVASSPMIALSLGTKLLFNNWGVENWKRLIGELTHLCPEASLVALGAGQERDETNSVLKMWSGRSANLCGETSPRVSAAVLSHAAVFIGHDSGPMHLAAAVGTPCVAMFSSRFPPGQWFPRGEHNTILVSDKLCAACSVADCRHVNAACILSITVDQVLAALLEKLNCQTAAA